MKAITVENLSKVYSVATANSEGMSFREMLIDQARSLFKKSQKQELFYALKDVSFEVEQGEVLGIIGKNGSGKSTLLKILSKITAPTSGRAIVRGRVASLLEVGTGFHAELTGRENIFMSGIILGMKRWEINQHFDEIVSFAGVEQFLDMPVKKYSSGMRLRLAFSVAAHLQPEILLVDEVLAVGDYEFEKKCLLIIDKVVTNGGTVLLVSHDLSSLAKLSKKAILLEHGNLKLCSSVEDVLSFYIGNGEQECLSRSWPLELAPQNKFFCLINICLKTSDGEKKTYFDVADEIIIELQYQIKEEIDFASLGFFLKTIEGIPIFFTIDSSETVWFKKKRFSGRYTGRCTIPKHFLNEGHIMVSIWVTKHFVVNDVISFKVKDGRKEFPGARGAFLDQWPVAAVRPWLKWTTERM